jgi:3D (Asp-Asp-Asp) domain-containing protein
MVENDQVDIILVTKMDRLHRSLRNFLNMQDTLDRHHCHWKAIWEPSYDTTTPQGRMVINMMMNLAQFEAENTSSRIKQVFAYKAQKGEVISGSVTPGYSIVDKHLVPNEDADIVRRAFETFDRTNSIAETVRTMAGTGLPSTKAGMRYMLKREVYTGKAHGLDNYCEPIISQELFDRVQLALSRNIKSGQKRTFLFSGLIKCAECGYTYSAQAKKSGKKDWLYYRCPKKYNEVVKKCTNKKIINESTFERRLIGMLPSMVVEQVEIPYETVTKDVSASGTETQDRVVQEGRNGIKELKYKVKFQNDEEVERNLISETVVREPREKIIQISTKIVSRGGVSRSAENLAASTNGATPEVRTMNASAYCSCAACCGKTNGVTSSGAIAQPNHTIAAGPGLPIGTVIYIPALAGQPNGGWFRVEDRGGAISNNRIDIFMGSHAAALQFGRRNLECYVYYQ